MLDFKVRLVGGTADNEGRVEISYNGAWGTICDDSLDQVAANIVCRQLGYQSAIHIWHYGYFGRGEGYSELDKIECTGFETNLGACKHSRWGNIDSKCYGFDKDVGLTCKDTSQPQPTPPIPPTAGRC